MAETDLTLKFKVQDDGSIQLDKFSGKLAEIPKHIKNIQSSLGPIKWDSIVNLGQRAINAAGQLYDLAKQTASFGSELQRNARTMGMTISEYQKWTYVAKSADVELGQFLMGVRYLNDVMNKTPKYVEQLGISVKDSTGNFKTMDAVLPEIVKKLSEIDNVTEQNAKAMELFGSRSGIAFANLVREGKNIDEIRARFRDMNLEISEGTVKKLAESEQAFKDLEFAGQKLKASLHPIVQELARDAEWWATMIGRVVDKFEMMAQKAEAKELLELKKMVAMDIGAAAAIGYSEKDLERIKARIKEIQDSWKTPTRGAAAAGEPGALRQSEEAAKALAKAMGKVSEEEAKLNAFYADDVELLKQATREVERRAKGLDIMEELGIKTEKGAEREIAAIEEKYKALMGQGYRPEEMEQARLKLEEQLRGVGKKYEKPSGWQEVGEEGGVRWMSNKGKDEMTRNISEMVEKSIAELERMEKAATQATGPKTIMIDSTPVDTANQAVEELRKKLDDLNNQVVTITIKQRIESDNPLIMEQIENGLVSRITNKQSALGSIIKREIDGRTEYSNY